MFLEHSNWRIIPRSQTDRLAPNRRAHNHHCSCCNRFFDNSILFHFMDSSSNSTSVSIEAYTRLFGYRRSSADELLELARLVCLEDVRAAAEVLALDEDVGYGPLAGLVGEVGLSMGAWATQYKVREYAKPTRPPGGEHLLSSPECPSRPRSRRARRCRPGPSRG